MQTNLARAPLAPEDAAYRAMFAARKQVFIDLLKWDLPVLADEFEVDQFDNPDANYLILLDKSGQHRASARLLPTDRPHLLGDLYPFLCNGPVPTGPTVFEITRFCLDRNQRAFARRIARDQLVTALAEHALRTGITDYTGVAELSWFNQISRFGWQCSALGKPLRVGRHKLVALHIRIDDQTLDGLRRAGIYLPLSLRLAGNRETQA
jgi:acyl homoserine lactone synthase/acyl-homoserine lactone synthase